MSDECPAEDPDPRWIADRVLSLHEWLTEEAGMTYSVLERTYRKGDLTIPMDDVVKALKGGCDVRAMRNAVAGAIRKGAKIAIVRGQE